MSKYERELKATATAKVRKPRKDRRIQAQIKRTDERYQEAVEQAALTELLLAEEAGMLEAEGMEKTYHFQQRDIVKEVDYQTASKKFDFKLTEFGPYTVDFLRNGRHMLIGGRKGHVALMDWRLGKLGCELHLGETVNTIHYLHNNQYFAAAQKKYTFIYDHRGTEIHRLKHFTEMTLLDFLPYHFLLVGAGHNGWLKYCDTLTGELVSAHRTKLGPTQLMKQNPWNAVMHLGHANGSVSLWLPSMLTPLAKIQCSRGPVRDLAIDREGKYMVVAGADKLIRVWDLRKYQELNYYHTPTPAQLVDISDRGLVLVAWNTHVTVWKDLFLTEKQWEPYMKHLVPGSRVENTQFVPFEDILGVGHAKGVELIIVPGAGEANYDALEINPYESAKQRQELEVRALLNKLPADLIALDPTTIGTVDPRAEHVSMPAVTEPISDKVELRPDVPEKNSKFRKQIRNKRKNVIDERKLWAERNMKRENELRRKRELEAQGTPEEEDVLALALLRFD